MEKYVELRIGIDALLPRGFQGNMNYWFEDEVCTAICTAIQK